MWLTPASLPSGVWTFHSPSQKSNWRCSLASHAASALAAGATAIFAARLYSQSERKLTTIQGFLDLLAK